MGAASSDGGLKSVSAQGNIRPLYVCLRTSHRRTQTHRHTHKHTRIYTHRRAQTRTTHTDTHRHTQTHTHTPRTHTRTHTQTHATHTRHLGHHHPLRRHFGCKTTLVVAEQPFGPPCTLQSPDTDGIGQRTERYATCRNVAAEVGTRRPHRFRIKVVLLSFDSFAGAGALPGDPKIVAPRFFPILSCHADAAGGDS